MPKTAHLERLALPPGQRLVQRMVTWRRGLCGGRWAGRKDTEEALGAVEHGNSGEEAGQLHREEAQGEAERGHQPAERAGSGRIRPPLPKASADPGTPTPPPGAHWTSCFSYSSGVNWRGRQAWMLLSWRAGQEKKKGKKVKRRDWAAGTGRGGPGWGGRDPGEEGARAERGPLQAEKRRARALPCPARPRARVSPGTRRAS